MRNLLTSKFFSFSFMIIVASSAFSSFHFFEGVNETVYIHLLLNNSFYVSLAAGNEEETVYCCTWYANINHTLLQIFLLVEPQGPEEFRVNK